MSARRSAADPSIDIAGLPLHDEELRVWAFQIIVVNLLGAGFGTVCAVARSLSAFVLFLPGARKYFRTALRRLKRRGAGLRSKAAYACQPGAPK